MSLEEKCKPVIWTICSHISEFVFGLVLEEITQIVELCQYNDIYCSVKKKKNSYTSMNKCIKILNSTMWYHLIPIRMATIKPINQQTKARKKCKEIRIIMYSNENVK